MKLTEINKKWILACKSLEPENELLNVYRENYIDNGNVEEEKYYISIILIGVIEDLKLKFSLSKLISELDIDHVHNEALSKNSIRMNALYSIIRYNSIKAEHLKERV